MHSGNYEIAFMTLPSPIVTPPITLTLEASQQFEPITVQRVYHEIVFITLHGLPAAKVLAGISRVTTLPAPITQPSPIVTPSITVTLDASQQFEPITVRRVYHEIVFITLHGLPAAKVLAGISRVTTLPAPITQPSPIVTPPITVTLEASQQLLPITMGFPASS